MRRGKSKAVWNVSKNLYCRFWAFLRAFLRTFSEKKLQHNFPKMRGGGRRPLEFFSEKTSDLVALTFLYDMIWENFVSSGQLRWNESSNNSDRVKSQIYVIFVNLVRTSAPHFIIFQLWFLKGAMVICVSVTSFQDTIRLSQQKLMLLTMVTMMSNNLTSKKGMIANGGWPG